MKKYMIYCDLDGVLTDFNEAYYTLTKIDITGTYNTSAEFFAPINKAGVKFWDEMPWTIDGKELWEYIKCYDPVILSAPTTEIESKIGKILWVNRELPNTRIILKPAEDKKDLAGENKILIDDMESNIMGWNLNGGIGILHTSTENTIRKLKKILENQKK
jgi:hypothetical protein